MSLPLGATTTPTAPSMSAVRAVCARPWYAFATACAPRISALSPMSAAAGIGTEHDIRIEQRQQPLEIAVA